MSREGFKATLSPTQELLQWSPVALEHIILEGYHGSQLFIITGNFSTFCRMKFSNYLKFKLW